MIRSLLLITLVAFGLASSRGESAKDIEYGPTGVQPRAHLLDVSAPAGDRSGLRPVVFWIHGGGWFQGDKSSLDVKQKSELFRRNGFVFVAVNYRLSPDLNSSAALSPGRARFPDAHRDVIRALGWVAREIRKWGGDPDRIILAGDSAGGQIAALLATRADLLEKGGLSSDQVRGVVLLDAVGLDIRRMTTETYRQDSPGFQRMIFNAFGSRKEERREPSWRAASPLVFADPGDPTFFFVIPEAAQGRIREARLMSQRLGQSFGRFFRLVSGGHSGVVRLLGNASSDQGITDPVIRFARAVSGTGGILPVLPRR